MLRIALPIRVSVFMSLVLRVCLFSTDALAAGPNSANLTVTIVDTTHAYVPDASSVVLNTATGVKQDSRSNKNGTVTFTFLKPGKYTLLVHKDGFANVAVDDIVLNVGDDRTLELTLKLGTNLETVSVNADQATINTTDGSVSTVIDRHFVENTPLNGRSFQDLISLTPGVVTQNPQTGTIVGGNSDFSVNGQRSESNYYIVDGLSANTTSGAGYGAPGPGSGGALGGATALGTTQSLISVDALQEFRVESSTYSAEFGRSPGGQFTFATRSGTDTVHGSAFDYLRNNFFDANDWFNDHYGKAAPALRQNDFGGTLGGPIVVPGIYNGRHHTFAFGSYEGLRLSQPTPAAIQYVPDTFMRQQANPLMQAILSAYPLQNGVDYGTSASPSLAQFIQGYSLPSTINSTNVRIDHTVGERMSIFFRFNDTPSSIASRTEASLVTNASNTQTYSLGATNGFTSAVTNDFRLGYAASDSTVRSTLDTFGGAAPIDLASHLGAANSQSAYSDVSLNIAGIGSAATYLPLGGNRGRSWNITDKVSVLAGAHHLSFGADYRHLKSPLTRAFPELLTYFYTAKGAMTGAPTLGLVIANSSPTPVFNETSLYAQDDWRLGRRLSLSLGVRWELDPPPTEQHGNDPYTLLGSVADPSTLTIAPLGTPLWKTQWFNFAPRVGLAWSVHGSHQHETVIRAGGGVFYDTANSLAGVVYGNPGAQTLKTYFGLILPFTPAQLNVSLVPTIQYGTFNIFPQHLQLPYTLEWNTSIQQALGPSQSFTISYVGANGRRLLTTTTTDVSSLNPAFSSISYVPSGITSNYQALQVQFQRSLSRGVQALASYTWSHAIDFGSTAAVIQQTRADSDFDVRNNLQLGVSWNIPGVKTGHASMLFLNGWGLDGRFVSRSAFPIPLQGNTFTDPATGIQEYSGLNIHPNQPIYLYGSEYPGGRSINPAAFTLPTSGLTGNAPRNFVRGFGEVQTNLAVRRDFPIRETIHFQFRAEAFNILNHPNFGFVDPEYTDATFGQATKMLNQSLGTVASQYQQGGPRSMQFALKLVF